MDKKEMIEKYAKRRASMAMYDAANCTSYKEEFEFLAERLAERMTENELKGFLDRHPEDEE